MVVRSWSVMGPIRDAGGQISVRSTIPGEPSGFRSETKASPTHMLVITSSVSNLGLARKVWAATFTAFLSLGVKALKVC